MRRARKGVGPARLQECIAALAKAVRRGECIPQPIELAALVQLAQEAGLRGSVATLHGLRRYARERV